MSVDLHHYGVHELTKKLCIADKFYTWVHIKNKIAIEKQEQAAMIARPHMAKDWEFKFKTNGLIKRKK